MKKLAISLGICACFLFCISGVFAVASYSWTTTEGAVISVSNFSDTVKLVYGPTTLSSDSSVNFYLYSKAVGSDNYFRGEENPIVAKVNSSGYAIAYVQLVSAYLDNKDENTLYFKAEGDKSESLPLTLTSTSSDSLIYAELLSPECGKNITLNSALEIRAKVSDEDDVVTGKLFVDGVNVKNFSNGEISYTHTFARAGSIPIMVEATNIRGKISKTTRNIIVVDTSRYGEYVASCISEPSDLANVESNPIYFNATGSRGLIYNGKSYSIIPNDNLVFEWSFDGRKSPHTSGSNPLAWKFYKTFTEAGYHSVSLSVSTNV